MGTYSAPPDPLAVFKGPTSKGKEWEGEEERKGRGRRGGERPYTPPVANSWLPAIANVTLYRDNVSCAFGSNCKCLDLVT